MATLQLFRTPPRNQHYNLAPAHQDSSPLYTLLEPSPTAPPDTAASTNLGQPQNVDQDNHAPGLSAGTIVAIIFSGLILIFLLIGAYTCASARHKTRPERRSAILGRRGYYDGDEDIEMQTQRHTRRSPLGKRDKYHSKDRYQNQQYPSHHEGAGMGYDEEDGKEAWIEVGTAEVARIRHVPAGSVSITNIGRGKAPSPLGSSKSVRDVTSLPDLAWAETLTTGGGRRPDVVSAPAAAAAAAAPPPATRAPSKGSGSERSKKLQERSESRRAVKRKAIREWCARGSGGGLGPYSAAY